jgi:hypothetical protein
VLCAGQKWEDAKEEARESGRKAKASVRDAASALAGDTRRGVDKADRETRGFLNRAGEAVNSSCSSRPMCTLVHFLTSPLCLMQRSPGCEPAATSTLAVHRPDGRCMCSPLQTAGTAERGADLTRDAGDRVRRDWPGAEVRVRGSRLAGPMLFKDWVWLEAVRHTRNPQLH